MLTKAFLRTAVGWGSAAHLRKRLDELEMSVQANPLTKKPELKCSGGNSRLIVFFLMIWCWWSVKLSHHLYGFIIKIIINGGTLTMIRENHQTYMFPQKPSQIEPFKRFGTSNDQWVVDHQTYLHICIYLFKKTNQQTKPTSGHVGALGSWSGGFHLPTIGSGGFFHMIWEHYEIYSQIEPSKNGWSGCMGL